eukprot:TRINITY_DN38466_c0_g1_i1.p1 TRINITY_DN38466_c0_g1~~TRINITY_DN38466_c0_g1_i1.p1  ORF type:complete len:239 (-),score=30.05 TRINITY_DN38466_c0_g1_i1:270-986(-)
MTMPSRKLPAMELTARHRPALLQGVGRLLASPDDEPGSLGAAASSRSSMTKRFAASTPAFGMNNAPRGYGEATMSVQAVLDSDLWKEECPFGRAKVRWGVVAARAARCTPAGVFEQASPDVKNRPAITFKQSRLWAQAGSKGEDGGLETTMQPSTLLQGSVSLPSVLDERSPAQRSGLNPSQGSIKRHLPARMRQTKAAVSLGPLCSAHRSGRSQLLPLERGGPLAGPAGRRWPSSHV